MKEQVTKILLNKMISSSWKHKSKRLGRGFASGKGKTSGRGQKGQKARERDCPTLFEGGQTKTAVRLPKRGALKAKKDVYRVSSKIFYDKQLDKNSSMEEIVKKLKIPFYYKKIKVFGDRDLPYFKVTDLKR